MLHEANQAELQHTVPEDHLVFSVQEDLKDRCFALMKANHHHRLEI